MRISIPSIPSTSTRPFVEYSLGEATSKVNSFLEAGQGKTLIMTGAGVSVDSGIAPYRGEGGHYTVHTTYRPIFYPEFIDPTSKGHSHRQRYWSRSFLGFKPVQHATPNPTHYSIAALQRMGYIKEYITQNVDNLHHAATPSPSLAASTILELHGTLQNVVCVTSPEGYHSHQEQGPSSSSKRSPKDPEMYQRLSALHRVGPRYANPQPHNTPTGEAYPLGCGFRGSRSVFQDVVEDLNPMWNDYAKELRETGKEPKTNPDGDVSLVDSKRRRTFSLTLLLSTGPLFDLGRLGKQCRLFDLQVPSLSQLRRRTQTVSSHELLVNHFTEKRLTGSFLSSSPFPSSQSRNLLRRIRPSNPPRSFLLLNLLLFLPPPNRNIPSNLFSLPSSQTSSRSKQTSSSIE